VIVFVFGSNQGGRHGAGAAADARRYCGAVPGVGEGFSGESYAIPTKGWNMDTRSLNEIERSASEFIRYASNNPDVDFQVTRIGCGLAGYSDRDIAPLFRGAPPNVHLPLGWRELLTTG
jgi:hypothetical protein